MTLSDRRMTSYQQMPSNGPGQPPNVVAPPPNGVLPPNGIVRPLSNTGEENTPRSVRFDGFRNHHQTRLAQSELTAQHQYKLSQEKTAVYFEKWQASKTKKSGTKRQRDSGNTTNNQVKRKVSNKADGPPSKKANNNSENATTPNTTGAPERQQAQLPANVRELLLFDDQSMEELNEQSMQELNGFAGKDGSLDNLDENLVENLSENLDDLITMMHESESSNASAPDTGGNSKMVNGTFGNTAHLHPTQQPQQQPPPQQQQPPQQRPPSQQPPQQQNTPELPMSMSQPQAIVQQQSHPANTPSPQQLQLNAMSQQPGAMYMRQQPVGYPQNIKAERPQTQYSRSMSESHGLKQHLERQASMPAEYMRSFPAGTYPSGTKPVAHLMPGTGPQHAPTVPQDYGRQLSVPNGQPGAYYRSQMPTNGREYLHGGAPSYSSYAPSQYPSNQHMSAEEMQRIERLRALQKAQLAGVAPAAPNQYVDPRTGHSTYYPSMMSAEASSAAAMQQHQAALRANSMHQGRQVVQPIAGQYMHSRPGYPVPVTGTMPTAPMMTRQLSAHHQPEHNHSTLSKLAAMQHPAGAMARGVPSTYPSSQPVMATAAPAGYPSIPSHPRPMTTMHGMMPQQHPAPHMAQHHMARPQSNGPSQVIGHSSMVSTNPHIHSMHRPMGAELHPQQQHMMPQSASSPPIHHPHTTQTLQKPHQHVAQPSHQHTAQNMYMHSNQSHQRTHPQMQQHGMVPQSSYNGALTLPQSTSQPTSQPPRQQQYQDDLDLNDLEFILSRSSEGS